MAPPIKLSIPGDPKYLGLIRKVLQELLDSHEVPADTARRLILCVDEACANVIKHGYDGPCDEPIEATFTIEGDDFKVQIRDYGKQCDTSQIKPRRLDDIKPGGLGTHFMNAFMMMSGLSPCRVPIALLIFLLGCHVMYSVRFGKAGSLDRN
jgi:anti-sigma regulatory factor (Ser/Thr protein kinase)